MKSAISVFSTVIFLGLQIFAQADIHKFDFRNFAYFPSCTGAVPEKVTVTNGEYSRGKKTDSYVNRFNFKVLTVNYGDLTGDKQDEAVILTLCSWGTVEDFSEGLIYSMKEDKPSLIARVPGGNRADGGLRSLTVENGLLIVDADDEHENLGTCCPEYAIKTTYRLDGDKLAPTGQGVLRDLHPEERISVNKGTSGKTFTLKLAPDDLKRYVLAADEGQTLTVTVNTDAASLRLFGFDEYTYGGETMFKVKLPKKGDYIFEVGNRGVDEIQVTVTVKIT